MTITLKPKHFLIGGAFAAIGFSGYYFRNDIKELFTSGAEKTVDKALAYLKNTKNGNAAEGVKLFSIRYVDDILSNYSFYKIEEWKLKSEEIEKAKYKVDVDGTTINGFGAKLNRTPSFIVEKRDDSWIITDSYGFAVIEKMEKFNDKSDIQKHNLMEDLKNKVVIENWSYSESYGDNVKGKGTIVNNSDMPVSYVKFAIEYKNNNGEIVNTDETYAVGSDELLPGQKRNFEWYTSNCYNCSKASSYLKF
jgi:hypothetical protein